MRKKIRFFRQHTMETCGPSCVLMILDLYQKLNYPTPKQEAKLYSLYRSQAYAGTTGAAMADCLSKNGLSVSLLHSSENYMDNRDEYFSPSLFSTYWAEYRSRIDACKDRVSIQTGAALSCTTIREALDTQKQVIVQCIVPGNADGIHEETLHWIVVYGYEGEEFLVCDPLSSKIRISSDAMERYMDTPIGRICVVVGE